MELVSEGTGGTNPDPPQWSESEIRPGGAALLVLALEPAEEVLNSEAMALLGDQPSDEGEC
jgi:hypothetical protein